MLNSTHKVKIVAHIVMPVTADAAMIQNLSDEASASIIYLISALMIHRFIQPPLLTHKK